MIIRMIAAYKRWRGLPCHVAYKHPDHPDLKQGMALCLICGKLYGTKPRLSYDAISSVIGP